MRLPAPHPPRGGVPADIPKVWIPPPPLGQVAHWPRPKLAASANAKEKLYREASTSGVNPLDVLRSVGMLGEGSEAPLSLRTWDFGLSARETLEPRPPARGPTRPPPRAPHASGRASSRGVSPIGPRLASARVPARLARARASQVARARSCRRALSCRSRRSLPVASGFPARKGGVLRLLRCAPTGPWPSPSASRAARFRRASRFPRLGAAARLESLSPSPASPENCLAEAPWQKREP